MDSQKAPTGLGKAGKALWASMTAGIIYRPDELAVLEGACKLADVAARLETATKTAPLTTFGSTGQKVVNPLLQELRVTRAELSRQLAKIDVPETDADGAQKSSTRTSHRQSARKRWHQAEAV